MIVLGILLIRIDIEAVIVNMISKEIIDEIGKNGIKVILIYMMEAKTVIYNVFFKEEASVSNGDALKAFQKNIHLIHFF